jgi:tRNA-dihydrouridine synthase A
MDKIISVAPMMDWTDRHCRFFHRLLSPSVMLYTEMVTANALIHGDADHHLRYDHSEHPITLQLGGSEPEKLAQAIDIAKPYHYDEINLNCGCPSDRVQSGAFGACLMATPEIVRDSIKAMRDVSDVPVTVKCRIGIDDADEEKMLSEFVKTVSDGGCEDFIIHARKAWLSGLSPKENRDIPPLNYDLVAKIKQENPNLKIHLNGGITDIKQMNDLLPHYDGLMIGRAAYQTPKLLVDIERSFFNPDWVVDDDHIINTMINYANAQHDNHGTPIKTVTKHIVNLFQGVKGARKWRQIISETAHKAEKAEDVLLPAYDAILSQI